MEASPYRVHGGEMRVGRGKEEKGKGSVSWVEEGMMGGRQGNTGC